MATGLLEKPCLGPCHVTLRPYQEEALTAVRSEFLKGRKRTLLNMFTGGGKTITFGMAARRTIERGGRVLVLAHTDELIEQAVNKLDYLGVESGVEKGTQRARSVWEPDCVVATVQTMQSKRLDSWPSDYFKLVVVDEAHHGTSVTYQNVVDHFGGARILGVSATLDRSDGESLGQVFESVAYEFTLWDAMLAPAPGPYACRLKFVQCDVAVDLRDLRPGKDDYSLTDLEARIAPLADTLANAIRKEIGTRKTVLFAPLVASAQALATALASLGLRAEWVCGDDPDRKVKIERYRQGEIQILCNANLLAEGFDVPDTAAVVLCRPTKSRSLYSQQVGRATRPVKPDALIIDFDFLTAKHDLVKPVELFDGSGIDSEVSAIAADMMAREAKQKAEGKNGDDSGSSDLLGVIERAREEHQKRQVLRIQAHERDVKYRKVAYDPLSFFDAMGLPWRGPKDAVTVRATEPQVQCLLNFGVEDAPNLSKTRASTMISFLKERRRAGLATHKQVSWLIAKGIDPVEARKMTFAAASATLDRLFSRRA